MKRSRTTWSVAAGALLLAAFLFGQAQQAQVQALRVVGARLSSDRGFANHGWGIHNAYLGDHLDGGRLFVVLANDGDSPMTIERLEVGGRPFDSLGDDTLFSERIESLNWWQAAPRTLAPGERTSLRIRLLELGDFGDPIRLTLGTDSGDQAIEVTPQRLETPLWLPFVGFAADEDGTLNRAVVYVANAGTTPITLPASGGVRLDERAVSGRPAQRSIPPGGLVPIALDLEPAPSAGDWLVVDVTAEGGESTIGSLRAFETNLSFSFWQLGENAELSAPHLTSYGIDQTTPGASVVVDEPFRVRMEPREMAARLEVRRNERPETPTMVQLSGYEEVLLYSDLADITMTHHRDLEQDLSLSLSWPKPIWYLPQNAWGRNSRPGADERWYPLEDLELQALTGLAAGAKHLQWFSYWNQWQQGHGRGGGFDATRNQLDLSFSGAIGNPTLLDRVGRLSLTLGLLEPYLALSAPAGQITSPAGIEATTLISGVDRGVVVLLDRFTPVELYLRSDAGERPRTRTLQSVEALAPPYLVAERAYLLDPFEGVRELPFERVDDTMVRFELDRFTTAAVIVLGDERDGEALRADWDTLTFSDPDTPLARVGAWAERAASDWRLPDHRYRLPLEISNNSERTRTVIEVLLDHPPSELGAGTRFTLVEVGADGDAREVTLQYTPAIRFFAPSERSTDLLDPSGSDRFAELYGVERSTEGIVNRYRSHLEERYAFSLTPEFAAEDGADAWLTTDFRRLEIDALGVEAGHAAKQHRLFVDFDLDGDGERDGGSRLLLIDLPSLDLDGGWRRYLIDVEAAFEARFPDEGKIHGRWRPRFEIEVSADDDQAVSSWTLGAMRAHSNARLQLIHRDGIPVGESRNFELYIGSGSTERRGRPPLAGGRLSVRAGDLEVAGVDLAWSDDGTLQLTPQARGDGLLVQRWSAAGDVVARALLPGSAGATTLSMELLPDTDELLEVTTLDPDGGGHRFAFVASADGSLYDHSVGGDPETLAAAWSEAATGWHIVDSDLSPDGRWLVVSERQFREDEDLDDSVWFGRLRLLDDSGTTTWSWPPEGEVSGTVFFARFAATGQRLFAAAQRTPIDNQDYDETELIAFDMAPAAPVPAWRHTVGEGYDEPGRAVHRLVTTADGGLLYADWHSQVFRLDAAGVVLWRGEIGGYVLALADDGAGGAYALNFSAAFHLNPDGSDEAIARRAPGTEGRALGVSPDGDLVAFADAHLTLVGSGSGETRPLLGRHPRVIAVSDASPGDLLIVVGASDGRLQLFGADGVERWSQQGRGSMVADLKFLSDGTLLVAREEFAYDPDTLWRYRTVVEAVTAAGERVWRQLGPWHEQPAMARLALDAAEAVVSVAGGEASRIELPRLSPRTLGPSPARIPSPIANPSDTPSPAHPRQTN